MIISSKKAGSRADSELFEDQEEEEVVRRNQPNARRVIVVEAGHYNGPNHKSLGYCEAGADIEVASGPYFEFLVEAGLVTPYEDATFPGGPESDLEGTDSEDKEVDDENAAEQEHDELLALYAEKPWLIFTEAGVSEALAEAIYQKFASPSDIYHASGGPETEYENLQAVKGVGLATAEALYEWASDLVESEENDG